MTNEEAKVFLDNLKICINEHPVVADWLVEIADRKTEPSNSGKPNNCETCRFELYCPEMCEGCCEWDSHYEPKTEPTISKMEQVEDEPQLTPNYCGTCKHREVPCGDLPCDVCHSYSRYEPKDEPQTDGYISGEDFMKIFDEPQTERSE